MLTFVPKVIDLFCQDLAGHANPKATRRGYDALVPSGGEEYCGTDFRVSGRRSASEGKHPMRTIPTCDFAMPAGKALSFGPNRSRLLGRMGLLVACGGILFLATVSTATAQGVCNRTPQVRDQLVEEVGVSECGKVTSEHLARLTSIHLYGINTLRTGDFDGLTSLRSLFFPRNSLSSLPPDVFSGLTSLEWLSLSESRLTALPEDIFSELTSLEMLWLEHNQLTTLPEGLFSGLNSLQEINLWGNQLTALPEGLFSGLNSLQKIGLWGNQLTTLPQGLFSELTSLEQLWLGGNHLISLPEDLFSGLNSLWWLRLGMNRLTFVPDGLFNGLNSLLVLELDRNQLTTVPEGLLSGLNSLYEFQLNGNQLTAVPEGLFRDLSSLERLYLYSNQLTSLPPGLFNDLPSLKRLYLDNNRLTSLPEEVFISLTSLTVLRLSDNKLTSLPPGLFSHLASLTELYLDDNQMTSLPEEVFSRLYSLRYLWLPENRLTSLPKDLFSNLNSLQQLELQNNQLTSLPEGIFDDVLDTLAGPVNSFGGSTYYGELVVDNHLKARLVVASPDQSVPPGSSVTIAITLSRALPLALYVPYSVSGTSNDHTGELLFLAGENAKEITLTLSDGSPEVSLGEFSEIRLRRSDGTGPDAPYLRAASLLLRPDERDAQPYPEDPSNFSSADLAGQRLTLDATRMEGTGEEFLLIFHKGKRFEQIRQSTAGAAANDSRFGHYDYDHTGPQMGILTLGYDDGESCTIEITFASATSGRSIYGCSGGRSGSGNFQLRVADIFVPVILSSVGLNDSFFTSEMTLTNRGAREARLDYTYTAHEGEGSGTASEVLPFGQQRIVSDAIGHLRSLGIPIPESGNHIGTLRVAVSGSSGVKILVRTTTAVPEGRAGLAYLGVAEHEGFEGAAYLYGLQQNSQDRSNIAFQNMGAPGEGAITLRTRVYEGNQFDTFIRYRADVELKPGEFHQYDQVLDVLPRNADGFVKVERVEGTAPFYAYGVINDQVNSDGSFVFPVRGGSLEGKMRQTLPVIVETSEFTSELTVANFSDELRTLEFEFVSEDIQGDEKRVVFRTGLEAGEQQIIPEFVEEMRRRGRAGLGTTRGFYVGPLFAEAQDGDMRGIVIGARTGSKGDGGQYSVFYNAVPEGEGFIKEAWVEGLQQNEENRSNLALVNTGEVDDSPSVFHLEIYNGQTGILADTVVTKPIPARGWHQIDGILLRAGSEIRQGYIRIEKMSGENPFLAYGVVNDGGAPGERSGDGAYLPARE